MVAKTKKKRKKKKVATHLNDEEDESSRDSSYRASRSTAGEDVERQPSLTGGGGGGGSGDPLERALNRTKTAPPAIAEAINAFVAAASGINVPSPLKDLFLEIGANDNSWMTECMCSEGQRNYEMQRWLPKRQETALRVLQHSTILDTISVNGCQLGDSACFVLGDVLANCPSLTSLSAERNEFLEPGLLHIAVSLAYPVGKIKELRLAHQRVTPTTAVEDALAEALLENKTVTKLGLNVRNADAKRRIDAAISRNLDRLRVRRNTMRAAEAGVAPAAAAEPTAAGAPPKPAFVPRQSLVVEGFGEAGFDYEVEAQSIRESATPGAWHGEYSISGENKFALLTEPQVSVAAAQRRPPSRAPKTHARTRYASCAPQAAVVRRAVAASRPLQHSAAPSLARRCSPSSTPSTPTPARLSSTWPT